MVLISQTNNRVTNILSSNKCGDIYIKVKRHSQYVLRLYLWSKPLILGKKGVSQKEMQEINDTVEALFPQTAPTPPPRQKIAKLRGKSRKNSAR